MGKYRVRSGRFIPVLIVLVCGIGLTIWGAWSTLAWAKNNVLLHLLDVQSLVQEEIRETRSVEGLLVKHEESVKAPASGQLRLLLKDGDRLRTGALLAEINGITDQKIYSPAAGVFCTHIDNLENLLVPGMIDVLDMSAVEKINSSVPPVTDEVVGGQIIGKVVDNLQPMLVFIQVEELDESEVYTLKKDSAVTLLWKDKKLTGKIIRASVLDDNLSMFVELSSYPENYIHERWVKLDLVTRQMTGWIAPEESIVFKESKPGLYVVSKQVIRWIPVAVKDRLQGMVAVSGDTLSSSTHYIKNPGWAREGDRLDKE